MITPITSIDYSGIEPKFTSVFTNADTVERTYSEVKLVIKGKDFRISHSQGYDIYTDNLDDNKYDIGLVFLVKPKTNIWKFDLEYDTDFNFCYQKPTQEMIDALGIKMSDDIIGSYAVYFKDPMKGKAFHIYRPELIDNNGSRSWCEMHINEETKTLEITGDSKWLETAVYPVVLDPTIGYTTIGGVADGLDSSSYYLYFSKFTMPVDGTVTGLKLCCNKYGGGTPVFKAAIYDASRNLMTTGTLQVTPTQATKPTNDSEWTETTLGGDLVGGTVYYLTINFTGNLNIYYDDTGVASYYGIGTYAGFPASPGPTMNAWVNRTYSCYITYTTGPTSNIKTLNCNAYANIKTVNTNVIANVKTINTNA